MGRRHGGAKDLSAGHERERERNLGSGRAVEPGSLEEADSRALSSDAVRFLVHVRIRWPSENGEVREVPAALRDTACCLLESTGEWQAGDWRNGVSRGDEQDKKPHGRSGRLLRKLRTSDQDPGKKNHSGSYGSSGEEGLDLVERREEPGGH